MQRTRGLVEDAQLLAQLSIDKQKTMTGAVAAAEQLKVFAKMLESCTETVDKQLKTVADNKDSDLAELADDVTTIFSNIRKFRIETMSADGPAQRIENTALRKDLASALTKIEALQHKKETLRLLCVGISQVRLDDYKAIEGIEAPTHWRDQGQRHHIRPHLHEHTQPAPRGPAAPQEVRRGSGSTRYEAKQDRHAGRKSGAP